MKSPYVNGLRININEIVKLEFIDNNIDVASVATTYEVLKQIHIAIGQCIKNHDSHLARQVEAKSKTN